MKIPHSVVGRTRPSSQALAYLSDEGATPDAFGASIGRGLGQLGQFLEVGFKELEEKRNKEHQLLAQESLTAFQLEQSETLNNLNDHEESFRGIDNLYGEQFVEKAQALLDKAPDPQTRQYMQELLAGIWLDNQLQAQTFERTRNESAATFTLQKMLDEARNIVRSDPSQLDAQVGRLEDAFGNAGGIIPRQALQEKLRMAVQGMTVSAMRGRADSDPDGLLGELHGGVAMTDGQARLMQSESGGRPQVVNEFGFAGLYQFGAPRLADIGVYSPGKGENLKSWSKTPSQVKGKWTGQFNIPGHPNVKSLSDFLASPGAQQTAFRLHTEKMDQEIVANGFDKSIGTVVNGVRITHQGLRNMLHLGGVGGTKRALRGESVSDANGTTLLQYAQMGADAVGRYGGVDAILSPEQKENLIAYSEAKIDDRFAAETAYAANQTRERKERQDQNNSALQVRIATEEATEAELTEALSRGDISAEQFRVLRDDLREEAGEGDDDRFLQLKTLAVQGQLTYDEALSEKANLSSNQLKELINNINTAEENGGVLARQDVQLQRDRVDQVIGGVRGPLAILDGAKAERVANALEEFSQKVANEPDRAREIADEVIARYRSDANPPNLQSLPSVPYWSGGFLGTKTELETRAANATRKTLDAFNARAISENEFRQIMLDLRRYREVIEGMEHGGTRRTVAPTD